MKKRVLAMLLAMFMVITSVFSAVPMTAQAAEGEAWSVGITDEAGVTAKRAIWMDETKSMEERVQALLATMTLAEKAAQMVQPEQNGDATPEIVKNLGIGSILSGGGSAPTAGNSAQNWADRVNAYKAAALQSRLGIPLIYGVDAVHGHNNIDDSVIFPHNIGLGASGDEVLVEEVGAAAAEEIRATGIQWTFAPMLGVVYSERWGRYYESFGEKSAEVASMGAAYVKGFQGTEEGRFALNKVAATAKHYVGEGQTTNGTNQGNVELTAEEFDALLVSDGLLEPYRAAIAAGARTVMASYSSVDGLKCHGNKHLLTDILKGEATQENPLGLGFTGFVVSDYNGVDQLSQSTYNAKVAASIDAGVDMFMEPNDWQNFINAVVAGYNNDTITAARIDDAVSRILQVKFEMGLFEEVVASATEKELLAKIGSAEHKSVAREAVSKSMVLLKNEKIGTTNKTAMELLQEANNVLVAGYKANDIGAQCGGWTISWQGGLDSANGSGGVKVTAGTTIYEGFQEVAKEGTTVSYNARGMVSGQDVAVVVVGESPYAETNGDSTEAGLKLSDQDLNVIKTAISSAGDTPMVLVLTTGRPLAIADFIDEFDAVVESWLPGTEGAGIADVMLDTTKEFSATMPVTWTWYPQDLTAKFTDATKVLFPYGTGLKKDGTSILPGGQTAITELANRPEAPQPEGETTKITRNGGIDVQAYSGKVEGEFNNSSGTFGSYNVVNGSEVTEGQEVGYVEWSAKDWGNAKWVTYFRQAGTYTVTARMKVAQSSDEEFKFGLSTAITGDGVTNMTIDTTVTEGYVDVPIGEVTIAAPGLQGIKIMDGHGNGAALGKVKLDYLQFTCTAPTGEQDTSQDEVAADPSDETVLDSEGTVIAAEAVDVYMTSTEKSGNMDWYKFPTDMANQLTEKTALDLTSEDTQDLTKITVNSDTEYQEILGLGTSLEESTINNLSKLTPAVQEKFLRSLIDPAQGGMTLFRLTIGTSDFTSKPFYTYYDAKELTTENAIDSNNDGILEPDWYNVTGHGFTIQKDIDYKIVDTVEKINALAIEYGVEDEIKYFGSSWTPPGWMKDETSSSESYTKNELLIKGGALKDEYIDDLAMYYTRYLEEYAKLGIDLHAITLQNEPLLEINYPSCAITGVQEGKLTVAVKEAVNKSNALNAEQKQVKLWAFDHNPGDAYSYVTSILSVPGASEALDGVAFHDYGGSLTNMQNVLDNLLNQGANKNQTVNLTERSVWGTAGANSIITYLRNSAISYSSWVTMLDSNVGVHQWVGTPDPTMFARAAGSDNDYWAMPEFYITGQFSRFIRPGYVRVDSNLGSTSTVTDVVFKNPETGELVAVVVNATAKKQDFKIINDGMQFIGAIPAGNIATYVWKAPTNVQNSPEEGFDASKFANASAGVTVATDGSISMASADDYADYIVNVKQTGQYHVTFDATNSALSGDDYRISIYQGDTLKGSAVAVKAGGKAQAVVNFDTVGLQNIRIKVANPAIALKSIQLEKTKEIQNVPGKINANEFVTLAGENNTNGATISSTGALENTGWWTKVYYKVNVPADDTYTFSVAAATEEADWNRNSIGFWLKDVVGEQETDILACGTASSTGIFGSNTDFNVSGSWSEYAVTSADITLTAGEHTLVFNTGAPLNIAYLSIGSTIDVTADPIMEGSEAGKVITVDVTGGTIADLVDLEAGTEVCTVANLPEGVTYSVEKISETKMEITLAGSSRIDFDSDWNTEVTLMVKQGGIGNVYACDAPIKVIAVNDAESLVVPEQDLNVPAETSTDKTFTLKLSGGIFDQSALADIAVSGDAASYYTLKSIDYVDAQTIDLVFTYTKKFYRAADLKIDVPESAYSESTGNGVLTTSITCQPAEGLPEGIALSSTVPANLTEAASYANSGSLAAAVEKGNYVDYFLDVKEAGTYVVTYTMSTVTSNGTSYANAWEVNRGVPGSLGTNSYKQVNIPPLWTSDNVKLRHTVELAEGLQTIEFKSKTSGYQIAAIEIAPITAETIDLNVGESKTIAATKFYDVQKAHAIINDVVEYTVAGNVFDYKVKVMKAGTYKLKLNYAIESSTKVSFDYDKVSEKGVLDLGAIAVASTGAWSTFADSGDVNIELAAGEYTLRLNVLGDGANLKQLTLGYVSEHEVIDPVKVASIQLSASAKELTVGDTDTLTATLLPLDATDKSVTWTSDNSAVASVENGVITAIAAGTATIKVASVSDPSIKATCNVTVADKTTGGDQPTSVAVSGVMIDVSSGTFTIGQEVSLIATVAPANATNKNVTWTSSNLNVATVTSEGRVKAIAAGTATITVASLSDSTKKATYSVTVNGALTPTQTPTPTATPVTGLDKTKNLKKSQSTSTSFKMSWGEVAGATKYEVILYRGSKKIKTYSTTKNYYTFTKLTSATEYRVKVRTVMVSSAGMQYGLYSSTYITATNPTKVSLQSVKKVSTTKTKITWKKTSNATGYVISMKVAGGKYKSIKTITKGSTLSYTKNGLKKGKTYYFKMKAYKKIGTNKIYGSDSKIIKVKM